MKSGKGKEAWCFAKALRSIKKIDLGFGNDRSLVLGGFSPAIRFNLFVLLSC
jgi:hypothetical protein